VGEDPDRIRQEIVDTRERMSETVDALSYKADVPARTKDRISNTKDATMDRISSTKDAIVSKVSGATPDTGQVKGQVGQVKGQVGERAHQAVGLAQSNPLGLAVGAAAAGFLAGMMLPSTRIENERMGEVADQVKERAGDVASEALDHGKQVAQEAASSAMDTAKQATAEHGSQLKDTAQQQAQETQQTVRS